MARESVTYYHVPIRVWSMETKGLVSTKACVKVGLRVTVCVTRYILPVEVWMG